MADTGVSPPTDRCRPVLFALSAGDRRRQRELDTAGHLLECDCCLGLSTALFDRRPPQQDDDEARVMVTLDADVVTARQQGRDIAARAGFTSTDLTLIATAISEIARNIVKFARRGEIVIRLVDEAGRRGVTVVARDAGPGIADIRGRVAGRREHLPRPRPGFARRPPVDGRVRHGLRSRQGNHRDDGEMAMTTAGRSVTDRQGSRTMTTGDTTPVRRDRPTTCCFRNWLRICGRTARTCARNGPAGSPTRTCCPR